MNYISNLLSTWGDMFNGTVNGVDYSWMGSVFGIISIVLYVIMGVVGAVGAVYAIYLGVQLARAEDQSKRDDAKKHLITVVIAVAVTVVGVLFFNELLPLIVKAFLGDTIADNPNYNPNAIIGALKMLVR